MCRMISIFDLRYHTLVKKEIDQTSMSKAGQSRKMIGSKHM